MFFLFTVDSVSVKELGKFREESEQVQRQHDKATQDVLNVEFPTWYFSTHGLSRPSTPVEEDQERYVKKNKIL